MTLYSGAVYQMYRYQKYTDVRLVFAPEFDIAFFGVTTIISSSPAMTSTSLLSGFMKATGLSTSNIS